MREPKKPTAPTYTTREKIAIRLFGSCKRMSAYNQAKIDYEIASREYARYESRCRAEASVIRTPKTPIRVLDTINPTRWVTDPTTGRRYTVDNYKYI